MPVLRCILKVSVARPAKIHPDLQANRLASSTESPTIADTVHLSEISTITNTLRNTASTDGRYGPVRPELLANIRQDMANGTFGGTEDLNRALDALLGSL